MPKCEYCRAPFSNDNGLKKHRRHCTGQELFLQESLVKRRQAKELFSGPIDQKRARVEVDNGFDVLADGAQVTLRWTISHLYLMTTLSLKVVVDVSTFHVSSRTPLLPPLPPRPAAASRAATTVPSAIPSSSQPAPFLLQPYTTSTDHLGLFRSYPLLPSSNPDNNSEVKKLLRKSQRLCEEHLSTISMSTFSGLSDRILGPFDNFSQFALVKWHCLGPPTKSKSGTDDLVNNVLRHPLFDKSDFSGGFNLQAEFKKLDRYAERNTSDTFDSRWTKSSVYIKLPSESIHQTFKNEDSAPKLKVDNVYHRKLVPLIKSALADPSSRSFHYTPFKSFRRHPSGRTEQVFDETYTTDAWLIAHEELYMKFNRIPNSLLEIAIVGLNFSSDATHLAHFGNASMWPIYVFYTNDSKYLRATPTMHRCHHLAYLPSLPPDFQEKYANEFGYMASQDVITHCKRELIQEYWRLILDDEFMDAFENGIVMTCADGVTRRIFPRPFTYSADYPEKVSLTCIQTMGLCSCIRCTTTKVDFIKTATIHDMNARKKLARIDNEDLKMKVEKARKFIYERGKKIHSEEVENQLKPLSLTPTRNAFSERFSKFGFNYFEMFVPNFMHEIELGIWKHLFIHLLRLLYAVGGDGIQILNKRYRDVPTFGNGTIRRFNENASALKKLVARDYEDLLLCSIPIFDGLFPPPHDKYVSELLHAMSTWHSLAKLRQHTDSTLEHLRVTTSDLWRRLRQFLRTTCTVYVTKELPKEEAARGRRKAALSSKKPTEPTNNSTRKTDSTRKEKLLNLLTYKFHSSADYVETIRRYGTTDSYSTQTGELEHCRLKKWYLRTNKTNAAAHIAIRSRCSRTLRAIDQNYNEFMHNLQNTEGLPNNDPEDGNYSKHHLISKCKYTTINLTKWLDNNRNDLAFENFLPRLKDHILMRLLDQCDPDIQYSDYQRSTVTIVKNVLYSHKTVRINYTTYDGCRAQDCLSARKMSDVMVLSREDQNSLHQNPYWYAHIIGIFHVNVLHTASASHPNQPQSLEIVWVRWFGSDPGFKAGFKEHRLPRIGFVPTDSDDPFGFISPEDIIRGVHLIPAFTYGYTDRLLSQDTVSIARHPLKRRHDNSDDMNVDWVNHYVNIFVDRDMFMRFRGGGISHCPDQVANSDVDTQIDDELEDFDDELLENLFTQQDQQTDQDLDEEDILENDDLTDDDDEDNKNISDRESSDEDEQDDSGHARVASAVEDLGFDIL